MGSFVILFSEKEGTTAQVEHLVRIPGIAILRRAEGRGREPMDRHNCGHLRPTEFAACLDQVLRPEPMDAGAFNAIYEPRAGFSLPTIDKSGSWGLKMRLVAPWPAMPGKLPPWNPVEWARRARQNVADRRHQALVLDVLARHGVTVFVAVRQDLYRWALSKCHGDGTGHAGHIQFKVQHGKVTLDEIPPLRVAPWRMALTLWRCEQEHARKRALVAACEARGIRVFPLVYESFLRDKRAHFAQFLQRIGHDVTDAQLDEALAQEVPMRKVHAHDTSQWVVNHEQIDARFGHRWVDWEGIPRPAGTAPPAP